MASIYIHIPFCKQACTYCNFHFSTSLDQKNAYLAALAREVELTKNFFDNQNPIESIYFGGGTPGILEVGEIATILDKISCTHTIATDAEITLEANPDDCSWAKTIGWKTIGINRLSIGVQSFDDAELRWMNRAHDSAQAFAALNNIGNAGFENFTADLIYGSPFQPTKSLKKNIRQMLAFNVPHLSCYALTVEEKTLLKHMIEKDKAPDMDAGHQLDAFDLLAKELSKAGYEQYEISNFAKPGYRSKHNSSYWQGKPYLGIGASAHSFNGSDTRRWNIANNALYIQSIKKNHLPYEEETLSPTEQLNEYIMTGLRTIEGIELGRVEAKFGPDAKTQLLKRAEKFLEYQLIELNNNALALTRNGKFLGDGIAADLFFEQKEQT